jgi:hypothetical protein
VSRPTFLDYEADDPPPELFGIPRALVLGTSACLLAAALLFTWSWCAIAHFRRLQPHAPPLNSLPNGAYYEFWASLIQERAALVVFPLIALCTFIPLFRDRRTRPRSWLVLPLTFAIFFAFAFAMACLSETAFP